MGRSIAGRLAALTIRRRREPETEPETAITSITSCVEHVPDEVLAEIFNWYILEACWAAVHCAWTDCISQAQDSPAPYSWLIIRHICRRWRAIALSYPQLSTKIFLTRPECVQDLLGRSGSLALLVYSPSLKYMASSQAHLDDVNASFQLIMPEFNRISGGILVIMGRAADHTAQATICKAHFLHFIDIKCTFPLSPALQFPDLEFFSVYSFPKIRPIGSILQHSPRLRTLKMVDCSPISATALLRLLAPLTTLEQLTLRNVLRTHDAWPHIDDPEFPSHFSGSGCTVPRLQYLEIVNKCGATAISFLHRLEHPPTTTYHLEFDWVSRSDGPHSDCACLITMLKPKIAAWRDLSETPFRSLLLGGGSPGSLGHFRLHLWQEYHPVFTLNGCVSVIPTDPAFFHLEVQSRGSADRPPAFFAGLQRCLPLAGVTSAFLFHLCITWNAVDWEALFGGMPELDELALRYEIVDGTEAMRSLDTSVHCPRLKTLSVEEVYTRSPDGGHRGAEALAPAAVTLAHVGLSLVKEERRGCMMAVRKHGRMFKPREPAVTRRSLLSTLLRRGGR